MNRILLNAVHDDGLVIKKGTEGGDAPAESTMEYLDVSGVDEAFREALMMFSIQLRSNTSNGIVVTYGAYAGNEGVTYENLIACSIDFNGKIISPSIGGESSVKNFMLMMGATQELLDSIPRITEEEFYTI